MNVVEPNGSMVLAAGEGMVYAVLELLLVGSSLAAIIAGGAHLSGSLRALRAANAASTNGRIRVLVARTGRRASILRLVFGVVLLTCGGVLIKVPNSELDYPELVYVAATFLTTASILIVVFSLKDLDDRGRIGELLREADPLATERNERT